MLSDVAGPDAESIASRSDLERPVIQRSLGEVDWDQGPPLEELSRRVAGTLGHPAAVPARVTREQAPRLERHAAAGSYHYKARKQLAPLKTRPHERPRQGN